MRNDEHVGARGLMRRGVEPDTAEWIVRAERLPGWSRVAAFGASAYRHRGPERWVRQAALQLGVLAVLVHRWLWVRGVRL